MARPRPRRAYRLDGRDLLALRAHEIVEAGVALVPEGRGIFADLTVRENLQLGAFRPARARATRRTISTGCSRCFRGWPNGSTSSSAP